MENRQHIAIITSGYLPVPNILGGAVESLDTLLVRENEKTPQCNFTVFSSWAPGVESVSAKFKYATMVFTHTPKLVQLVDKCVYFVAKHVLHKSKLMSYRYIFQRLWFIYRVAGYLRKTDFDAVVIENHPTLFMALKMYRNRKKYNNRVYYHLHNEIGHCFGCGKEILSAKRILGVSQFVTNMLDRCLQETEHERLLDIQKSVLRNCIDTELFNPNNASTQRSGAQWKKKLGIQTEELVFLFSGRLTREKGVEELLEAFMKADLPHSRLVIVGSFFFNSIIASPFESKVHAMAEKAGKKIVFTGFVEYEDMPGLYAMADICVMPSIWEDPAPLSVIESMASGRALISTYSGGIAEYANTDCAILLQRDANLEINLEAALKELATHASRREQLGASGRKTAEHLTPSSFLQEFTYLVNDEAINR